MESQKAFGPSHRRKRKHSGNGWKLSDFERKIVEKQFEKKFCYKSDIDTEFALPSIGESLCREWTVSDYMLIKDELNSLKNQLNDKNMLTWHDHTRNVNLAGDIGPEIRARLKPELCTQAWCKFYETVSTYAHFDDLDRLVSVHLCEAPGAFVTSLNHFLYSRGYKFEWEWLATTLNPYYEGNSISHMIDEDRFIRCSYDNWYFGEDGTGDLMSQENLAGLVEKLKDVQVNLVTADGSIDCQGDPAEQENVVSRLQYCEVLTALHVLAPGGTLIIKLFTMLECKTVCLMYLLSCVFERVEVFKPCTSKGGNSEVYVIGLNFKGRSSCDSFLNAITPKYFGPTEPVGCLFSQSDIPVAFFQQHSECVKFFTDSQMWAIQRNLDLFKVMTQNNGLEEEMLRTGLDSNKNNMVPQTETDCTELTVTSMNTRDRVKKDDLDPSVKFVEERSRLEEQKEYCVDCFFSRYDVKPLPYHARLMFQHKKKAERKTDFADKVKLEGKFTGSFQERQELTQLPWKHKVYQIQTYEQEVTREDNSLWIQCGYGSLSTEEVESCTSLCGKAVNKIFSSKFCPGLYIHQAQEIIQHVQWLRDAEPLMEDVVMLVTGKLSDILTASINCYSNLTRANNCDQENSNRQTEADAAGDTDGCLKENAVVNLQPLCFFTDVKYESRILKELAKQHCSGSVPVTLYGVCDSIVSEGFELSEQQDLLCAVLNILKTSSSGDYALIEMGTSLTRLTAALVYILYRSFREIGFVHHHGNKLKRHLVCRDYTHCPTKMQEFLEDVSRMMQTNQTTTVLEVIPILTLLEDDTFTSFLNITNENLLQSFITTVVNHEKQKCTQADLT